MSALVVGSRSRISNAIVRGLGSSGVKVFTADSSAITRSGLSKFTSRHFTYTSPLQSKSDFFKDLLKIIEVSGAEVLLPGDVWLYNYLIKNKSRLENDIIFSAPEFEQVEKVATKDRLIDLATEMNVLTPKSIAVHSSEEVSKSCLDFRFPVLVKPVDEYYGRGITVAKSYEELSVVISGYSDQRLTAGLVVQEFIDGDNYGVGMILDQGEPCGGLCYKQIHQQPISAGAPTLTETSDFGGPVEILSRILERLKWHGICQADFILEKGTGKVYIIDINPRMFGALFTTIAGEINFPYLLYMLSLGKKDEYQFTFNNQVRTVWVEGEIKRFLGGLRCPRNLIARTSVRDYICVNIIEDFAFSDFKPFVLSPVWFFFHLFSRTC